MVFIRFFGKDLIFCWKKKIKKVVLIDGKIIIKKLLIFKIVLFNCENIWYKGIINVVKGIIIDSSRILKIKFFCLFW